MSYKQIHKIYSIHTAQGESNLIEIETIILHGLYRFSILGINQKNSSDIKDRVYSALRSQKLINLKSDNKKITVSLLPTNIDKKGNVYDLGIALSCLIHMDKIEIKENILAVGELSITGKIIQSGYLLKTISKSIEHGITTIICGQDDMEVLDTYQNNLHELIESSGIRFISATTLSELIENIKEDKYYIFKNKETKPTDPTSDECVNIMDKNIFKIILGICTNRNVFIENKKDSYLRKFIKNLTYHKHRLNGNELLQIAHDLNKTDTQLLEKYSFPITSLIDNQTLKFDLPIMLSESLFGFNVIDNFISIPEDILHITKKLHRSSILCFYNPCPCGNNNNLFNSFNDEKCLCLQRYILKYRQKICRLENKFFDFYIKNITDESVTYSSIDYINLNKVISKFKSTSIDTDQDNKTEERLMQYADKYEKVELDQIFKLTQDITKLKHILDKTKSTLSLDNMDLAIEFTRKGF